MPQPGIEAFAQSVMSPWKQDPVHPSETGKSAISGLAESQQWDCRRRARGMADGSDMKSGMQHAKYNYEFYVNKTISVYPDREVLVVRTEHEWDDVVDLANNFLGGNTDFSVTESVSHGSEKYQPSPITTEGYQKLCCVLEREIEVYIDLLERAANLSPEAKEESIESLKEKCGVKKDWTVWRKHCQQRLQADEKVLVGDKRIKIRAIDVAHIQ
jgi:hypothetical protein